MSNPLLQVQDLSVGFRQGRKKIMAVNGASFDIQPGETVGLVGESGSGKSTIANAILGLVPITSGQITFAGEDVTNLSFEERRKFYRNTQMVFQDPYSSLNPMRTIGQTLEEPIQALSGAERGMINERVLTMLKRVGLPAEAINRYPRELSGGQRQRVAIARALMASPKLVICDEATSALDLSVQAQVLNLLKDLQQSEGLSYLFVSHDLEVVRHMCDRVVVLYQGRVMESGLSEDIFVGPAHPYTNVLQRAALDPDPKIQRARRQQLSSSPQAHNENAGNGTAQCPFAPRCAHAQQQCWQELPSLRPTERSGGQVACLRSPEWRQKTHNDSSS